MSLVAYMPPMAHESSSRSLRRHHSCDDGTDSSWCAQVNVAMRVRRVAVSRGQIFEFGIFCVHVLWVLRVFNGRLYLQ